MIFTNPIPIPLTPNELYDKPPSEYFVHHDPASKRQNAEEILSGLEEIASGRKLLDVGCGQGILLETARSRGWQPEGLDISKRFVCNAVRKLGVPVHIGDVSAINLPKESYDVAILAAVLEHLPDPRNALSRVHGALKPGGLVWIDVPNEKGLYFRMGNLLNRLRGRDWVVNLSPTFSPGHLYGFSPKSLRTLLSRSGFIVRRLRKYQGSNSLPGPRNVIEKLEHWGLDFTIFIAGALRQGDGIVAIAQKDAQPRI